jgi:hypothetical protein
MMASFDTLTISLEMRGTYYDLKNGQDCRASLYGKLLLKKN